MNAFARLNNDLKQQSYCILGESDEDEDASSADEPEEHEPEHEPEHEHFDLVALVHGPRISH